MQTRQSSNVSLVDDGAMQRRARSDVPFPVEARIDDDRARRAELRRVGRMKVAATVVERVRKAAVAPALDAVERLRVRIEQKHVGIEAQPLARLVRSVHAIPVPLTGADTGNVRVPHEGGAVRQRYTRLGAVLVYQAQIDGGCVLRVEREVDAVSSVPGGSEGVR